MGTVRISQRSWVVDFSWLAMAPMRSGNYLLRAKKWTYSLYIYFYVSCTCIAVVGTRRELRNMLFRLQHLINESSGWMLT
jgi:hypothetical protein